MTLPKITTVEEQLQHWVDGESIHLGERGRLTYEGDDSGPNSCTPDFSCCEPRLQWDTPTRQAFMRADESTRHEMLINALTSAMTLMGQDSQQPVVHIAGTSPDAPLQ